MTTPSWYKFAFFLGPPPELTGRQWRVLGLVAAVSFFETYDLYLFTLNLKQIQADLAIPEGELGYLGSIVAGGRAARGDPGNDGGRDRAPAHVAVHRCRLHRPDRSLTALAPTPTVFVALQFLARGFATAETILAVVVIVEEFGPKHRGWGVGAAAAIQACGGGLASLLYGFVEYVPYGWRALYTVGLVPLALIAYWRRTLPETERFERHARVHDSESSMKALGASLIDLFRTYPTRVWALAVAVFCTGVAASSAVFFAPKYLQDVHGWSPAQVAAMSLIGGAFAIIGNPLAGWLSDRRGRKPTSAVFAIGLGILVFAFYNGMGMALPVMWVALLFFSMGTDVTQGAFSAEMFPTGARSTAASVRSLMTNIGSITGLAMVSVLYSVFGSNWSAIATLSVMCIFTPIVVLLFFPETAQRELEEIASDEA